MRIAIQGVTPAYLEAFPEITIIRNEGGTIIAEVPRYRTFTKLVERLVIIVTDGGARIVEIAGNDDILVSLQSRANPVLPNDQDVISVTKRPGLHDKTRILIAMKVDQLQSLRPLLKLSGLEHIYDY